MKYLFNRIRLWTLQGDPENGLSATEISKMKTFPPRESVEKAIIFDKRKID
jgi:hypothetical protein